jgi:diketogulonate reductase-like aldo/keto reductase
MRYTPFGKTGLQVSQIALGTGNFGTGWGHGADADTSKAVFEAYAEAGGNFIDTADVYQFGQSEELLGSLLEGRRENFVLATKFTRGAVPNADRLVRGNSRKAMVTSVEASLKRLKADRIDIYWVHYPDNVTPPRGNRSWLRGSRACRQDSLCGSLELPGLAACTRGHAGGTEPFGADRASTGMARRAAPRVSAARSSSRRTRLSARRSSTPCSR